MSGNEMPDVLAVVVEYEIGGGEGGGAYGVGTARRGTAEFRALIARAVAEADELTRGCGCEWAAVRFGVGEPDEVDCESGAAVRAFEG